MTTLELTDLATEWWRIENAANLPMTADERDELLPSQKPTVRAIISTPARTMEELAAKLRIYCAVYEIVGIKNDNGTVYDQVLASALQDAERMAGAS